MNVASIWRPPGRSEFCRQYEVLAFLPRYGHRMLIAKRKSKKGSRTLVMQLKAL